MCSGKRNTLESGQNDLDDVCSSFGIDPSKTMKGGSRDDCDGGVHCRSRDDFRMHRLAVLRPMASFPPITMSVRIMISPLLMLLVG